MDHDGQLEKEGRGRSQVHFGDIEHCDNLPSPETPTAENLNLNEANTRAQTHVDGCGLIQKSGLHNNGKDKVEQVKGQCTGRGREEEDEEEDTDEVMKAEEEDEEESSSLMGCQSPETPMTDSSFSETGSLLETPGPFSPGTSPELTSPVLPVVRPVELSQCDDDSCIFDTRSEASTAGLIPYARGLTDTLEHVDSTQQTVTSTHWTTGSVGSACIPEATDSIAQNTGSTSNRLTSSTETASTSGPTWSQGSASSHTGPVTSTAELLTSTTGAGGTAPKSTVATGPVSSDCRHITSSPTTTCRSVLACTTGSVPSPALLESLEQLAQRGDDSHLPQYLHQIAEAFVHHEDYQQGLWCIQLERLYHQRVLDNLKSLQEQWESQCRTTSTDLATKQLDTLKHICQTHTRPRTLRDAECTTRDPLRPTCQDGSLVPPCTSANQMEEGMERREEDSSCLVISSNNFPDKVNSPEISEEDREGPHSSDEPGPTDTQTNGEKEREAEGTMAQTISVIGNGLPLSTTGGMDQSMPAEQQGQDLVSAQEEEANCKEERMVEEAMEMEDEGEEEGEADCRTEGDSSLCQEALPVETLVSETDADTLPPEEALSEEELDEETKISQTTQANNETSLQQEADRPQEADSMQEEEEAEESESYEEYEEYEDLQDRIIMEAPSLDDMAKLITVEEISPACGLVSILKKRNVYVDNPSMSASSESLLKKPTAKRHVRFKVPDDGYEHDVGSGDSCLLLFLLCLVTVVISIGGTALYCVVGDAQSSVCQDFSRNADFYFGQIQRGIAQIQQWFALES